MTYRKEGAKQGASREVSRRAFFQSFSRFLLAGGAVSAVVSLGSLETRALPNKFELIEIKHDTSCKLDGIYDEYTLFGRYEGRNVRMTLLGVEHSEKHLDIHCRVLTRKINEGAQIVASEFPVGDFSSPIDIETCLKDNYTTPQNSYFAGIVDFMRTTGTSVALMEGYTDNLTDVGASFIGNAALFGWLFGPPLLRFFSPRTSFRIATISGVVMDYILLSSGFHLGPFPSILNGVLNLREKGHPIVHSQRESYYCAVMLRLLYMGYNDVVVVTGGGHTESIVNNLKRGSDISVPSNHSFRDEIYIVRPDGITAVRLLDNPPARVHPPSIA